VQAVGGVAGTRALLGYVAHLTFIKVAGFSGGTAL
jgi:hypothetical protein